MGCPLTPNKLAAMVLRDSRSSFGICCVASFYWFVGWSSTPTSWPLSIPSCITSPLVVPCNLVNHVEQNSLWTKIIPCDIVNFLLLVIMSFELVSLVHNLCPSSLGLAMMISHNLFSNLLPMLLLKNNCARTLNSLLHQLYKVLSSSTSPLPC